MRKLYEDSDFQYKMGANIWPSDDPNDSPVSAFVCKYCDHQIYFQDCGAFKYGDSREVQIQRAEIKKIRHRLECKKWPRIKTEVSQEMIFEKLNEISNLLNIIVDRQEGLFKRIV